MPLEQERRSRVRKGTHVLIPPIQIWPPFVRITHSIAFCLVKSVDKVGVFVIFDAGIGPRFIDDSADRLFCFSRWPKQERDR